MKSTLEKPINSTAVGMGEAVFARHPAMLTTILGSCVAVTLYAPRRRLGMLGHIVLPQSHGDNEQHPAKFADTAVPHMLATLNNYGVTAGELIAKIAGGACMFGSNQFARIGDNNVEAVTKALDAAGISISGRDVSGKSGRHLSFNLSTGEVSISCAGGPARII